MEARILMAAVVSPSCRFCRFQFGFGSDGERPVGDLPSHVAFWIDRSEAARNVHSQRLRVIQCYAKLFESLHKVCSESAERDIGITSIRIASVLINFSD